jgi:FtsH-binding integral membrane protein
MEGKRLMADELVIPPPSPKLLDYPASVGIALEIVFVTILLFVSAKFDQSGGVLTISLLIVLAFIAVVTFCVFFTVPTDEATSAVIGGLTASFGAIVAYWLGRPREPPK